MSDYERFGQQSGIIAPETLRAPEFTVVGAGAIGSFFITTLAKMGAEKIKVYDFDTIEEHNISNQMYPVMHIESSKVEALRSVVAQYAEVDLTPIDAKFTGEEELSDIVVSAVDSMDVRRVIWDAVKASGKVKFFFDGRMGAQTLRTYSIDMSNPDQVAFYEKSLYTSAQAVQARCTEKTIIFTVLLVAGIMLKHVKKRLNGDKCPKEEVYDCITDTSLKRY